MTKKFNINDWEIETLTEESSDGFIYGNIVDWDKFRKENTRELLMLGGYDLPFGCRVPLVEIDEITSKNPLYKYKNILFHYLEQTSYFQDLVFPSMEDLDFIIQDFLNDYGVYSGVQYEGDLPDELQFYVVDDFEVANDYIANYKEFGLDILEIRKNFDFIGQQIQNLLSEELPQTDEIKILILKLLIKIEEFTKSIIRQGILKKPITEQFSEEIKNAAIEKASNLFCKKDIEKYFKRYFDKDIPQMNHTDLRNSLAHEFSYVQIDDGYIIFSDKSKNIIKAKIIDVLREVQTFYDSIVAIIE